MVLSDFTNLFYKILVTLVSNNLFIFALQLVVVQFTIMVFKKLFYL